MGIHLMPPLYKVVMEPKNLAPIYSTAPRTVLLAQANTYESLHGIPDRARLVLWPGYYDTSQGYTPVPPPWSLIRSVLSFNTSGAAGKTLTGGLLKLYVSRILSIITPFIVHVVSGAGITDPPSFDAYYTLEAAETSIAQALLNTQAVGDVVFFPLTSYGLSLINKSGVTVFGLRTQDDMSHTPPPPNNGVWFYQDGFPGKEPTLSLSYEG